MIEKLQMSSPINDKDISLGISVLLPLLDLPAELGLLTQELLKFIELAYHFQWVFTVGVPLVTSLNSYTPTRRKILS